MQRHPDNSLQRKQPNTIRNTVVLGAKAAPDANRTP